MVLQNRLKKNIKHLSKWARKNNLEAYRLYDRDIPEYPYIIDLYKDEAVVWLRLEDIDLSEKRKNHLTELYDSLNQLGFDERKRFIKKRKKQEKENQYVKEKQLKKIRTIKEGELSFEVNLSDYLDTGLFLDHRPLRQDLSKENLSNKKALNLFSYTCSLSVSLAKAGAHVTSVDLSPHYLDWGIRNFDLNGINPKDHNFYEEDCIEFLKDESSNRPGFYDIIIIDPPTFSVSKKFKGTWDVQRDHLFVLHKCMDCLAEGGTLYFSTNLRTFKLDESLKAYKDISFSTIPQDFHDKKIHQAFRFQKGIKNL